MTIESWKICSMQNIFSFNNSGKNCDKKTMNTIFITILVVISKRTFDCDRLSVHPAGHPG